MAKYLLLITRHNSQQSSHYLNEPDSHALPIRHMEVHAIPTINNQWSGFREYVRPLMAHAISNHLKHHITGTENIIF